MWRATIGEDAGRIWKTLSERGPANISGVKRLAKLDDRRLYLALGWLCREDKIVIKAVKKQIEVGLR
jgi:hypothetical protein